MVRWLLLSMPQNGNAAQPLRSGGVRTSGFVANTVIIFWLLHVMCLSFVKVRKRWIFQDLKVHHMPDRQFILIGSQQKQVSYKLYHTGVVCCCCTVNLHTSTSEHWYLLLCFDTSWCDRDSPLIATTFLIGQQEGYHLVCKNTSPAILKVFLEQLGYTANPSEHRNHVCNISLQKETPMSFTLVQFYMVVTAVPFKNNTVIWLSAEKIAKLCY